MLQEEKERRIEKKEKKASGRAERKHQFLSGLTIIHHPEYPAPAPPPKRPLVPSQIIIPGFQKASAAVQEWNLQYHPKNYAEEDPYYPELHSSSSSSHHSSPSKMPHHPEQHRSSPPPSKRNLRSSEDSLPSKDSQHLAEQHRSSHLKDHLRSSEDSLPPKDVQHPEQQRSSPQPTEDHLSEDSKPIINVEKCGNDDRLKEPSSSGIKRTFQSSSDEDSGPSAKRLNQSLDQDALGSSPSRAKREPIPRNPDIFHDVYKWIKDVEQEEYRRRKRMVEDLVKLCKAIPLTVQMSNPLINFNALSNIDTDSMTQK